MKIGTGGNQILILHYLNLHNDKLFVMLLSPMEITTADA